MKLVEKKVRFDSSTLKNFPCKLLSLLITVYFFAFLFFYIYIFYFYLKFYTILYIFYVFSQQFLIYRRKLNDFLLRNSCLCFLYSSSFCCFQAKIWIKLVQCLRSSGFYKPFSESFYEQTYERKTKYICISITFSIEGSLIMANENQM